MKYVGGKTRIAKWVSENLLEHGRGCERYVEPFLGGGAIMERMAPHFPGRCQGSDVHPDLMMMWKALVEEGWIPPQHVSESDYNRLKNEPSSPLRGLVGFGTSWSGKWFGGFVEYDHQPKRDYHVLQQSIRSVNRTADAMRKAGTVLQTICYSDLEIRSGDLVYCDPPYRDTLGYSSGEFDHDKFWETVRRWTRLGATVLVSEESAPPDMTVLSRRERKAMLRLTVGEPQAQRVESIYRYQA